MQLGTAVKRFVRGYFATHERSDKTIRAYTSDLDQFVRFMGARKVLDDLSPECVEAWAHALRKADYEPASIRRKLASLRGFCNYWTRRNVLPSSPFWRIRLNLGAARQLPRVLTLAEVTDLLRYATRRARAHPAWSRSSVGPAFLTYRNLAIVELLFATGLRVGELAAIRLEHVSTMDRSIVVQGKGRRERLAFVSEPKSFATLKTYARAREGIDAKSTALFINVRKRPLSTQTIAKVVDDLARGAGLQKHVTPHMLRHTIATLLLKNGADLRVIQEFLGHASISMTQRYTHVARDQLDRIVAECHPGLSIRR